MNGAVRSWPLFSVVFRMSLSPSADPGSPESRSLSSLSFLSFLCESWEVNLIVLLVFFVQKGNLIKR